MNTDQSLIQEWILKDGVEHWLAIVPESIYVFFKQDFTINMVENSGTELTQGVQGQNINTQL